MVYAHIRAPTLPLLHSESSSPSFQVSPSQHDRVQRLLPPRKDRPHHRGGESKFWYRRGESHPNAQEDVAISSCPDHQPSLETLALPRLCGRFNCHVPTLLSLPTNLVACCVKPDRRPLPRRGHNRRARRRWRRYHQ